MDDPGMLHDLRILAARSCDDDALAACTNLLALPPVYRVTEGVNSSVKPYVLRLLLRTVLGRVEAEDLDTRAAGALIGVESRYRIAREIRVAAAAAILGASERTVRRREPALLRSLAGAITDFILSAEPVERFVKANRSFLSSGLSKPSTDHEDGEEALTRQSASTAPPPELGDILKWLFRTAREDPVAEAMLKQMETRDPDNARLLRLIASLYGLKSASSQLSQILSRIVSERRDDRALPDAVRANRWDGWEGMDAVRLNTEAVMFHGSLAILMMNQGYRLISGESEAERHARQSIQDVYLYIPLKAENTAWLGELLAWPKPGQELVSVARSESIMPDIPESLEARPHWIQFLARCECESDDSPDESCVVHAMIRACQQCTDDLQALATYQLVTRADLI